MNINHATAIGSGAFTIAGGTLDNTSGGAITLSNNNLQTWNGNFSFTGSNNLNLGTGAITMGASVNITTSANTLTVGGTINDNTKDFTKSGAGSLVLGSNAVTIANFTLSAGSLTSTSNTLTIHGHFTNNGTFTHNSGTVALHNGGSTSNITGSSASVFNNLTLNNSLHISLAGAVDATVLGTLTFSNGKISTNANKLILGTAGSAATVSGATLNNYIDGNIRRYIPNSTSPNITFDLGTSTSYVPVTVKFTGTVSGSGYLDVSTAVSLPDLSSGLDQAKCINRNWTIDNTNVAGFTSYGVVLNFLPSDKIGTIDTNLLVVKKYHSPTWSTGSMVSKRSTFVECSGFTNFSVFSVGQPNNALPIELLNFEAEDEGSFADLEWTTTSETNNDYFAIEKSENGVQFTEAGKIDAAGNSRSLLNYEFKDEYKRGSRSNTLYYRLKQTDFDGRFTYSKIIALKKQKNVAGIYPNPCQGISTLVSKSDITHVKVYDSKGIQILNIQNAPANFSDDNSIRIDLTNYPCGMYFVFGWNENNLIYSTSLVKK